MVLDRMSHAAPQRGETLRRLWAVGARVVLAAVVLGNAAGLSANIGAAVYFQEASEGYATAAGHYASNNTRLGAEFVATGVARFQLGLYVLSIQRLFEVAVLVLIVAAFAAAGAVCARRLSLALHVLDSSGHNMAAGMQIQHRAVDAAVILGREMRKEIVITTTFVFACFLIRAAASTMLALVFQLQNLATKCAGARSDCDASCYNMYAHMNQWQIYTPVSSCPPPTPSSSSPLRLIICQEFQPTLVLLSSPIALLVALRGMTNARTRQLMECGEQQTSQLISLHSVTSSRHTAISRGTGIKPSACSM